MKKTFPGSWATLALSLVVPACLLAVPALASSRQTATERAVDRAAAGGESQSSGGHQTSGGGSSTGGGTVSSGGGSSTGGSSSTGGGSSSGDGTAVSRPGGGSHGGGPYRGGGDTGSRGGERGSGGSAGRGGTATTGGGTTTTGGGSGYAGPHAGAGDRGRRGETGTGSVGSGDTRDPDQPYARPRRGQPVIGKAVPRTGPPPSTGGGGTTIYSPGYWYPWGIGGYGLYGGFYDPWYDPYGGYWGGYGQYYSSSEGEDGSLRLKIKPRDAQVFVDGYFAGIVDQFDGVFQHLDIEAGPHRVEIRAEGYEPLVLDVRIDPDDKTTYKGELKKIQ